MQPMLIGVQDPQQELQDDHKKALDGIFELLKALQERDVRRAREITGVVDLVSGPHWRWEEEALYPALRQFSDELVEGLMKEHDEFINAVAELTTLLRKTGRFKFRREVLAPQGWERARWLTQPLIYHLATCDGLIMWTEIMGEEERQTIKQAIFAARRDNIPLLTWAQNHRER